MRESLLAAMLSVAVAIPLPLRACLPGDWIVPETGAPIGHADLLGSVEPGNIVLLGEFHDNPRHHRWQASVISGLVARGLQVTLGLEAYPRRLQPVLDRWVAGELGETEFRTKSEWDMVWGFDWQLYLPLLELARLHRLPLVALNVERSLVRRVGKEGWQAIPNDEREGLSDPAPAPESYRAMLKEVMSGHHGGDQDEGDSAEIDPARFERFVQAQSTWDRAMAQALADYHHPSAVTIGIAGSGHLRDRHGIAHQLADLGFASTTWLPVLPKECEEIAPELADALFVIDEPPKEAEPRKLGVGLEKGDGGVVVSSLTEDSLAVAAGIQQGDVIKSVAGRKVAQPIDLVSAIHSAVPGFWMPLVVERNGVDLPLIVVFPNEQQP